MRIDIPIIGGAYKSVSVNAAAQRCINFYPEIVEVGNEKSPMVLLPTPGMLIKSTALLNSTYKIRQGGLFSAIQDSAKNNLLVVIGNTTYLITDITHGTWTGYSGLNTYDGPVAISENGVSVFMVDGTSYYTGAKGSSTIAAVSDAQLATGATHIAYIGGYYIINDVGTTKFRSSPVDWNGSDAWSGTAYDNADQTPGYIQGLIACGSDLFIFKKNAFEVWYNAGTTPFPFLRNNSVSSNIGTEAKYSLVSFDNSVFFVGSGKEGFGKIYRTVGYQPQRISTHALEYEISRYSRIDDAFANSYQYQGHSFYIVTFPSGDKTWCYDLNTGLWHERNSVLPSTSKIERWGAESICSHNGEILCSNRITFLPDTRTNIPGIIFKLDSETFADDIYSGYTSPIDRIRSTSHITQQGKRVTFFAFQVDLETGVGVYTGQGSNPIIFLRYSDDGGHTWSNKISGTFGKLGEFTARIIWRRLGFSRDRIFEISGSEPVPYRIIRAWADIEVGNN